MFQTDLVDLVNSGDAWALVGSGASIETGGPTWKDLAAEAAAHLDNLGFTASTDTRYQNAMNRLDFLTAFSRLESIGSKDTIEDFVRNRTRGIHPSGLTRSIVDWPFAGIITTNYDSSLEAGLRESGESGWLSVGNIASELPKVTGAANRIVWHIHGATDLPDRSRLILTQEDYDDFYASGSPVLSTLMGLMMHRRLVVFGFSFADPELNRLVRRIGSFSSPERPVFAFLGDIEGTDGHAYRDELRDLYNVNAISYRIRDGSHEELRSMTEIYGSLTLRRSLKLSQVNRSVPSWDAETTALLTYNELVLRHGANVPTEVLGRILKSRIIARLAYEPALSRAQVIAELEAKANELMGSGFRPASESGKSELTDEAISGLVADDLIRDTDGNLSLTTSGEELVINQRARAELLREQFQTSITDRAYRLIKDYDVAGRISKVISEFFEDCMRLRGVGVALAWQGASANSRQFQATALLQHLPSYVEQLPSIDEIALAFRVVKEILSNPLPGEKTYLGVRTQAEFCVQLLAYSPYLVATRAREISETVFVIDSNVLISFLAKGIYARNAVLQLINDLNELGAFTVTTDALIQEVRDHARWAKTQVDSGGVLGVKVLAAASRRAGYRENLFLEGFVASIANVGAPINFDLYLDDICDSRDGHRLHLNVFAQAFEKSGISVQSLGSWDGFSSEHWAARQEACDEIEIARRERKTFRSLGQVQAEAESRVLVNSIRSGELNLRGRNFKQAYFVSNSRVVDFSGGHDQRVTIKSEALLQWLSTLKGAPADQLTCLVDGVLGDLSEEGFTVVDRTRLIGVFAPTIDASLSNLHEQMEQHQILTSEKYGVSPNLAFSDNLDAPFIERARLMQRAARAESERDRERNAKELAEKRARLTAKEESELAKLRERAGERKKKAVQRSRAAQSRPRKKRK